MTTYDLTKLDETKVIENSNLNIIQIQDLNQDEELYITENTKKVIQKIKNNDISLILSDEIYEIGERSSQNALPQVKLYETLISNILKENQKSKENKNDKSSRDYNLSELRKEIDKINPSVLKEKPIKEKFLFFFSRSKLPGTDKILDIIYDRQETVKKNVEDIKKSLVKNIDSLDNKLADLLAIYESLLKSQRLLKVDIFVLQNIFNEVKKIEEKTEEKNQKELIKNVLTDIIIQLNSLIVEENMNTQFFTGSELISKSVKRQKNATKILIRQLEKSVLANLGLKIVAQDTKKSVEITSNLGEAISNTILDTANTIKNTQTILKEKSINGYFNLDKLQDSFDTIMDILEEEKNMNDDIIEKGVIVSNTIRNITSNLEKKNFKVKTIENLEK